ncbi:MAG TPA: hypothetical protein VIT44_01480 [Cyclobacteriaceae bacterium]
MENLDTLFKPIGELLTNKQLKEKDLMVDPVELRAEKSYPIDQGDVTFSIGAQASLTAQLFNDENDKDTEEFISATSPSYLVFKPAAQAYLKYQASVLPKGNASGSIESIGFEFEASAELRATYYKGHTNTEKIREAFIDDVSHFLVIFKWSDIQKLALHDALSFNVGGKLSAGLNVSWSNIFSQSLSSLTSALPQPITLDLNLSPKLTASFNVTINDQFSYFIKRIERDKFFVAISKIKNTKSVGSLGLSVSVEFSKPDELESQLNTLVDEALKAIVKKAGPQVERAIDAVKNKTATTAQNVIISEVATQLGLSAAIIDVLEERWKKLKEELKKNIKSIAEANAELSFAYEYQRIAEGKEVLSVNIPEAALKIHHPNLLRFKLSGLLESLAKGIAGAEVLSYLNQKVLKVDKSWGFGLKLMGKEFIKSRDFEIRTDTIRTDIKNRKQISQDRSKGYTWKLGKGKGKWLTEINATMKTFSATPEPFFSEVALSWYLNMVIEDNRVREKELREYLDMGVLWGSILQHDVDGLVEKYLPLFQNKPAAFESKLILSEFATKNILNQAGAHQFDKTNQEYMARSFAAAMGYLHDFTLRKAVQSREEAYAPLWLDYIKNPNQNTRDLAAKAYSHLRQQPNAGTLSQFEKQAGFNNQANWFADVVYTNPNTYSDVVSCFVGIADLSNKINANAPLSNNFDQVVKKINPFLSQSFYVRALGSFLNRYALGNPLLQKEVQRVFTITYGEEGSEQVINVTLV